MRGWVDEYVRPAATELANMLAESAAPLTVEEQVLSMLSRATDVGTTVSGCNRVLGGQNTFRQGRGRYVVIVNPIDGHVNYLRGSPIFGASITVEDAESGQGMAFVYDGIKQRIREFGLGRRSPVEYGSRAHAQSRSAVVSIVDKALLSNGIPRQLLSGSFRALGSTTIALLQIVDGSLDLYVNRTKLWNVAWAMCVSESHALQFLDLEAGQPVNSQSVRNRTTYSQSVSFAVYRTTEEGVWRTEMMRIGRRKAEQEVN